MNENEEELIQDILNSCMYLYHDPSIVCNQEAIDLLSIIKNKKYFKCVNAVLLNFIRDYSTTMFDTNYDDPYYALKKLPAYIDYDKYKNLIYVKMNQYIKSAYLLADTISGNRKLDQLVQDFYHEATHLALDDKMKYTTKELLNIKSMAEFLLTYLYMNDEYIDENDYIFRDAFNTLKQPSFYDEMEMNGVFSLIDANEVINAIIYYIEKAVKQNQHNIHPDKQKK